MKTIQADIFKRFEESKRVALLHCCNCFCTMGAGIALQVKERYPGASRADLRTTRGDREKLGTYSLAEVSKGRYVANLYGQYFYGKKSLGDRDVSYDALWDSMRSFVQDHGHKVDTILIPKGMGCGLAGGRWEVVHSMIKVLDTLVSCDIVVCEYAK